MRKFLSVAAVVGVVVSGVGATKVAPFAAVIASSERSAEDVTRDADRKPAAMLAFARVRSGMKIAEISPGGGYFTRLLSLAVGEHGYVYTSSSRPAPAVEAWAKAHGNVSLTKVPTGEKLAPEPVDLVWTTQNYHDFKNQKIGDSDAAVLIGRAAFATLKKGGVFLVGDHEAGVGVGVSATSTLHRIEMAAVIQEVEAAGFKLEARSDMLRHPADNHTLKVIESGIRGKTDQFVLRFRKPLK
jgi:predicted methyltransferase